jgi:hypothetical protein
MTITNEPHSASAFSTPLDTLLDQVDKDMQDDLVPAEIFNSDEVFRAEMERIFTNTGSSSLTRASCPSQVTSSSARSVWTPSSSPATARAASTCCPTTAVVHLKGALDRCGSGFPPHGGGVP